MTDEEIKKASDERRAKKKKKHILIHGNSVENLDERDAREKRDAVEVVDTGYKSQCRLVSRDSRWNGLRKWMNKRLQWAYAKGTVAYPMKTIRMVELKRKFVEEKLATRCIQVFHDKKKDSMFLAPVPMKMLNMTSVIHIQKKRWSWAHKYAYYGVMDMTPTSEYTMLMTGVNPTIYHSMEYELTEFTGKDRYLGNNYNYRLKARWK